MKKILLLFVMLLITNTLIAQVKLENISEEEAFVRAKKENKDVILMASTTW